MGQVTPKKNLRMCLLEPILTPQNQILFPTVFKTDIKKGKKHHVTLC
jgi:hypothetical protein